ncbi:lytic transglycosylase domain-containing protein [uncultured Hydrogenophaga sp.]|uniref:lytic transglycosylase domain-containing protein n=1 Tax=uncultured Hydrogenophaga sp. TaxID=199683 RepID=UPI00265D98F3|nr:lytic transglycosylase domain-containing protein [uncultured Hydrogenophaga sp.]
MSFVIPSISARAWRRPIMAALLSCALAPAWVFGQGTGSAAADTALLDMRESFRLGRTAQLTQSLPTVRGHVLEPLARYWEMRARLESAAAADIRSAMDAMAGTYWEDRLRNDWLLLLGRQRNWADFETERPRFRMNDDRQVRCYGLMLDAVAGRLEPALAAARVQNEWLAQKDIDTGCATAAESLLKSGHLNEQAVWLRARLMMETGKTRAASQAVALLNPEWAGRLDAIAAEPQRYLDGKLTAFRTHTKELVTLAIIRLASNDPAAAATEVDHLRWRTQLTRSERDWLWGVIGKRAAQRFMPEAVDYFSRGSDRGMADDHLAWKVRAALRTGRWSMVREAVDAMGPAQQSDPAWVYWKARGLLAQAGLESAAGVPDPATPPLPPGTATVSASPAPEVLQARQLLAGIASPHGFYEQLALETLGLKVSLPPAPPVPTPAELADIAADPGIRRALAAFRLGLRSEGVREWNYSVALHTPGGMSERELLAAATLACREELWDRCIHTSLRNRAQVDMSMRYPTPFRDAVLARTREIGLDPAYVYGLIRQESRFVTDARSGVGAAGLMQVMPATARWTARRIGLTDFRPARINERDTNIQIGTAYLKFALDDFEGSLPLAAAAYNAGPGRARAWREGPVLPGEVWAESIPFDETRDYVKRVLANTTLYAAQLSGQPQSLRQRLGTVGPRSASAQPPNTDLP